MIQPDFTKAVDAVTRDIPRIRRGKYGQDWIAHNLKDSYQLFSIKLRKDIREICEDLSQGPGKSAIFMSGLDARIVCMCIKPADVTELTKFYAILRTTLKIRTILMKWTSHICVHMHTNIWGTTSQTPTLQKVWGGIAFYQKKKRDDNSLPVCDVVTDRWQLFPVFTDHRTSCNQLNLQSVREDWGKNPKPVAITTTLSNAFLSSELEKISSQEVFQIG